jgi:hypothetical protein
MLTLTDLTPAQRQRFVAVATEQCTAVEALLADFRRDPFMSGAITGTLPHCGLYGLMEADGRCHT